MAQTSFLTFMQVMRMGEQMIIKCTSCYCVLLKVEIEGEQKTDKKTNNRKQYTHACTHTHTHTHTQDFFNLHLHFKTLSDQ